MRDNFWTSIPVEHLTDDEWEALCDGCGRCCLNKLQDEDSGDLFYTSLACKNLDIERSRCRNYSKRFAQVPDCMNVRSLFESEASLSSMPTSCAYRLRAEGKELPGWHPLHSGDTNSVAQAGMSVSGRVLSEEFVHESDWQNHIISWVEVK